MRGQVSTEFLMVNAVLLTIVLILAAATFDNINSLKIAKENYRASNALEKIYVNGLSVYYQGNGAKRIFFVEIPEDANMNFSASDNVLYFIVVDSQVSKKFDYPFDVKKYPKYGGLAKFEVRNNNGVVELRAK